MNRRILFVCATQSIAYAQFTGNSGYEHICEGLSLPDTGDLHVLSAAIQCDAQHIVTENMRDFPKEALEPYDIEAIEADEFLARSHKHHHRREYLAQLTPSEASGLT